MDVLADVDILKTEVPAKADGAERAAESVAEESWTEAEIAAELASARAAVMSPAMARALHPQIASEVIAVRMKEQNIERKEPPNPSNGANPSPIFFNREQIRGVQHAEMTGEFRDGKACGEREHLVATRSNLRKNEKSMLLRVPASPKPRARARANLAPCVALPWRRTELSLCWREPFVTVTSLWSFARHSTLLCAPKPIFISPEKFGTSWELSGWF